MPSKLAFVAELCIGILQKQFKEKYSELILSVHPFCCCPDWLLWGSDPMSQACRDGNEVGVPCFILLCSLGHLQALPKQCLSSLSQPRWKSLHGHN